MNTIKTATMLCVFALALPAGADWDPGDSYKMHYPQLPDPNGWDVAFVNPLGDDWLCTQTGPVSDIHLWLSFRGDYQPSPEAVIIGGVSIWVGDGFGPPTTPLWSMSVDTDMPNVNLRHYGTGDQGWLSPNEGIADRPDHEDYYQLNIEGIEDPFIQEAGQVYWLVAGFVVNDPNDPTARVGWKTSGSPQFFNAAVWASPLTIFPPDWHPLIDPSTDQPLDLAFVITTVPEPGTLALLLVGAAVGWRRWIRR